MKIVHLSDLHYGLWNFGKEVESTHYFIDSATRNPEPKDLADILLDYEPARNPDFVVVSGDLGWSGVETDYEFALRFLNRLRNTWRTSRFVINGGNHDVDLSISENEKRQDAFVGMLKEFYGVDDFSRLFPRYGKSAVHQKRASLVSVDHLPGAAVVVSVNSAATINSGKDPILILPDVFKAILSILTERKFEQDLLRVFVLHHHLLPFAEPPWSNTSDVKVVADRPDSTTVANSARLQSWLALNSFHLVLHGHKHTFHGREDTLWRYGKSSEPNKLVIIGAGSAGVTRREMGHHDPHSFNIVEVERQRRSQWECRIRTLGITGNNVGHSVTDAFEHRATVGAPVARPPYIFQAEDMQMCHRAIKSTLERVGIVANFMSIVEESQYRHLETSRIGDRMTTEEDIKRSFRALHPEWDEEKQWSDTNQLDLCLRRLPETYRIQHGPRLFGRTAPAARSAKLPDDARPIQFAYDSLDGSSSRAYVGLYNPYLDVGSDGEPLPGLVGIQFVKGAVGKLDIVMTFRNLELSFWWEVNMLEAACLLDWACKGGKFMPGRVTIFSALAEWRNDPRPMFVSQIDEMKREELVALVWLASMGNREYTSILAEKLDNKRVETSSLNIHYAALEDVLLLIKGILNLRKQDPQLNVQSPINTAFQNSLEAVVTHMRNAVRSSAKREDEIDLARKDLALLVSAIREFNADTEQ